MREFAFKDVIETKDSKQKRKENIRLYIDAIYNNKKPYKGTADLVLPYLMGVKNVGGFRPVGTNKNEFDIKYVVLFSTKEDIYWQDKLDEELGMYTYYGDNKEAGRELLDTKTGGNKILNEVFNYASTDNINKRKKIPPFFLFEKTNSGGARFTGLLVPGYPKINTKEWLTSLWAKRREGGRFQNYKALFTVLNIDSGSEAAKNEASIDLRWLEDLKNGKGYNSKYAPNSWKKYIKTGKFTPLTVKVENRIRNKIEQLPNTENKMKMLSAIHKYFIEDSTLFEQFAVNIVRYTDPNIINCENTRPVKDGGRDAIGEYKVLSGLTNYLKTTFALEAKCYKPNRQVGVKETSRLISRIKHREFGIMVTTSFVGTQAYEEIIKDNHPIAIISGGDIINILFENDITDIKSLEKYLKKEYPKS